MKKKLRKQEPKTCADAFEVKRKVWVDAGGKVEKVLYVCWKIFNRNGVEIPLLNWTEMKPYSEDWVRCLNAQKNDNMNAEQWRALADKMLSERDLERARIDRLMKTSKRTRQTLEALEQYVYLKNQSRLETLHDQVTSMGVQPHDLPF